MATCSDEAGLESRRNSASNTPRTRPSCPAPDAASHCGGRGVASAVPACTGCGEVRPDDRAIPDPGSPTALTGDATSRDQVHPPLPGCEAGLHAGSRGGYRVGQVRHRLAGATAAGALPGRTDSPSLARPVHFSLAHIMNRRTLLPALIVVPGLPVAAWALRSGARAQAPEACSLRCDGEQVTTSVRVNAVDLRSPKPADGPEGRFILRCPACGRPIGSEHAAAGPADHS